MSDFPGSIVTRLVWDGWYQGRNVEPWDEIARLDGCGYPVFPSVWQFLIQFCGLTLWRDIGRQFAHSEPAALDFTLQEIALPYDAPEMKAVTSHTALAFCYVGQFVYSGKPARSAVLMMDEHGVFYRLVDFTYLDLIGHTPADMVTNFYTGLHSAQRIFTLDIPLNGNGPGSHDREPQPAPTPAYPVPFYSSSSHSR
jgi:hypothetical protein